MKQFKNTVYVVSQVTVREFNFHLIPAAELAARDYRVVVGRNRLLLKVLRSREAAHVISHFTAPVRLIKILEAEMGGRRLKSRWIGKELLKIWAAKSFIPKERSR